MTPENAASAIPPVQLHAVHQESPDSDFGSPRSAMCLNHGLTDAELKAFAPAPAPVPGVRERILKLSTFAAVFVLGSGVIMTLIGGATADVNRKGSFNLVMFGIDTFAAGIVLFAVATILSYAADGSTLRERGADAARKYEA